MTTFTQFYDGRAVASASTFPVVNPATGELAGEAPKGTPADVNAAVAAAKRAFVTWRTSTDAARRDACLAMAQIIEEHAEELAQLVTREQGKPLDGFGSRFEVGGCAAWLRNTASLTLPVETIQDDAAAHIVLHRKPIGVVACIAPWNWPLMIAAWQLAPAIRTGNTVVVKPSPLTPLSTLRLVELAASVLPAGVLNVVSGLDDIAPLLTAHPDVAKIAFTGSTATGRRVMASAADTLKRLTLELGGNDAAIVLPDVDPAAVVQGIFGGAFINSGQTCTALKRLYVHADVYDALCDALAGMAQQVPVGNGLDEGTVLGPVQTPAQVQRLAALVADATAKGARVLAGGAPLDRPGNFFATTILADCTAGMRVVDEEQFGPILPVIRYDDLDAAIAQANASESGLGGSVWSGNPARAAELVAQLECGISWVNSHGFLNPNAPLGGVKQSGVGVEFGIDGLKALTTSQTVFLRS
jgi:acyl-CoA reductase-like NAD-dependent aldehyde dehydrogenase